jgi:hypothetical protein
MVLAASTEYRSVRAMELRNREPAADRQKRSKYMYLVQQARIPCKVSGNGGAPDATRFRS